MVIDDLVGEFCVVHGESTEVFKIVSVSKKGAYLHNCGGEPHGVEPWRKITTIDEKDVLFTVTGTYMGEMDVEDI